MFLKDNRSLDVTTNIEMFQSTKGVLKRIWSVMWEINLYFSRLSTYILLHKAYMSSNPTKCIRAVLSGLLECLLITIRHRVETSELTFHLSPFSIFCKNKPASI